MNCPRCKSPITQSIDPDSIITCPGCGARLMTRAAARKTHGKGSAPAAPPPAPAPPKLIPEADEEPPAPPEPGNGAPEEAPAAPATADLPPSVTLPPTPAMLLGTASAGVEGPAVGGAMLEMLLSELQQLRANQERMLELLGGRPVDRPASSALVEPPKEPDLQPVRSRQRKSVLLIDDDAETRDAAVAELEQADIPVRAVDDGNEALRLIAEDKPDVIALELALGGEMAGKDLINTVKATMEWVDIPIILWTSEAVTTQKEARVVHGADEVVQKSSGAAALVTRVITLFRRA